jgi:hypothetical protein
MAFSTHDIVPDSPTNNFAALNPLYNSSISLSDGNLTTGTFLASAGSVSSSMQMLPNAITYFEIYYETSYLSLLNIGLLEGTNTSNSWGIRGDGEPWNNAPQTAVSISFTTEDVLGVIVDIQNSKWYLAKNGALQLSANISNGTGYIHNNLTSNLSLRCWNASNSGSQKIRVNFGQDPTFGGASNLPTGAGDYDTDASGNSTGGRFAFQPPTGALALCTANLPDFTPTVTGDVPADYFKAVIWTGDNIYPRSISTDFAPDLIWTKARTLLPTSNVNSDHLLMDSVRGDGNLKWISSSQTNAEGTYSGNADADLTSSGFTIQSITGTNALNDNNAKFVAWCWKAGGVPTADNTATSGAMNANGSAATSSNSSVSINGVLQSNYTPAGSPTIYPKRMSINTDAGFSIVKYYGNNATNSNQSIPSGLSSLDFVIIKDLDDPEYWFVYHKSLSTNHNLYLQLPNAQTNVSTSGGGGIKNPLTDGNIVPLLGNINTTNINDTHNFIAYCWHSVEGYSKFGSYEGSTALPFVYCGFRPALVICKCTSDTTTTHTSWAMYDNARDSSNVMNKVLYANKSIQEGYRGNGSTAATDIYIDFLSNGFKVRSTKEEINDDGETYIFMAFAEQPFKFSNAR